MSFKIFGCGCFILNNEKNNLGKFDAKADKVILLDYSSYSHSYRVYSKKTITIEKFVHIVFDETNHE